MGVDGFVDGCGLREVGRWRLRVCRRLAAGLVRKIDCVCDFRRKEVESRVRDAACKLRSCLIVDREPLRRASMACTERTSCSSLEE